MKKIGKDILIALISALATGLVSYVATNASVENSIVTEMSEYFASVDEGMSYKQAIATAYEENQTLSTQVQQLQNDNSQLGEQVDSAPEVTFFSPSLVQDGLEISSGINNGVAKIDGRIYIATEAVDPFMNGTITFDEGQNILASGTTDSVAVTKENLLDTNVLYDGELYEIIPNKNRESISVAGTEYREGVYLRGTPSGGCYVLLNLKSDYSTLVVDIGRLDGSDKGDMELEVYLDGELSTTFPLSSDTPLQTIEIPLNYAGSMKLRLAGDHYVEYCIVNPILVK